MQTEKRLKAIGKKIRELRRQAGYGDYAKFAYDHEINRQTVLNAEQGKPISMNTFLNIISALGVTPEEFFKGIK